MKVIKDFIPKSNANRSGTKIKPAYITVHNTENTQPGTDALNHARFLTGDAERLKVSWHFTVDDQRVIQHLPLDEEGWHSGSTKGNEQSIAVEICENRDGDFNKAVDNAVSLINSLMEQLNISIENVVPHQHWSEKYCPRKLLPVWQQFLQQIQSNEKVSIELDQSQRPTLKYGDNGDSVNDLQSSLNKTGFSVGKVDGIFGPKTESAVKEFQKSQNLKIDGIVGSKTWNALEQKDPRPLLSEGDQNEWVKKVQSKLKEIGIDPGPVDGIFGERTKNAVEKFQLSRNLSVDGIVGPKTWSELDHTKESPAPPSILKKRGDVRTKKIALTYDAGAGNAGINILDVLKKHNVKSTFFLTGKWVDENKDLARRIRNDGHEIGNHTYTHPNLTNLPYDQMIKEIKDAENSIINVTGINPQPIFRQPYGAYNSKVLQAVGEAGYPYSVYWSIDTLDWRHPEPDVIVQRIIDNAESGAIVLLHVGGKNTPEASDIVIPKLKSQGFDLVPVSELF